MKRITYKISGLLTAAIVLMASCQKMDRPVLDKDYPKDSNPPGGPLKFYVAFDGVSDNPLINAVDSIRASYPSSNPLASVDGISGKAVKGENKKFIAYARPNDFASAAKAFSVSCWYKRDGQTQNNTEQTGLNTWSVSNQAVAIGRAAASCSSWKVIMPAVL